MLIKKKNYGSCLCKILNACLIHVSFNQATSWCAAHFLFLLKFLLYIYIEVFPLNKGFECSGCFISLKSSIVYHSFALLLWMQSATNYRAVKTTDLAEHCCNMLIAIAIWTCSLLLKQNEKYNSKKKKKKRLLSVLSVMLCVPWILFL